MAMPSAQPVLLFDLGGVLVEVAPITRMLKSLGLDTEPGRVKRWVSIDAWVELEVGEIDGQTFSQRFTEELALSLDPARVLNEFEAWNVGLFPGAAELLAELRTRHRLTVLSNTNEIHWRRLAGEIGIPDLVDTAFASHLIGLRKPDERVYRHVAAELDVEISDLVFFDDNRENVEAAHRVGMQAHQVEGLAELRERLTALGYL
jgi:glucose-1-phosphatase